MAGRERERLTFRFERRERICRIRKLEHSANRIFRHSSTELLAELSPYVSCHLFIGSDLILVDFAMTG